MTLFILRAKTKNGGKWQKTVCIIPLCQNLKRGIAQIIFNISGGKTKDGGEIVGASVFYSSPPESETRQSATGEDLEDEISKLDAELKVHNDLFHYSVTENSIHLIT